MMKTRWHRFLLVAMLILGKVPRGEMIKNVSQKRSIRTMVGRNVNFTWQFPFEDNIWKTLFAPNSRSIVRIGQDSAPEYDHPSLYEGRASLVSDGVMLKNLSRSDEGLYRTQENYMLLNHTIILSVYMERELQPIIFIDEMLVMSTSTLMNITQTIRIITLQQLPANITLTFSNGWNTASFSNVRMCVHGVGNLPKPDYDFNVTIHVDYGFYETQINLPLSVKASHDVTNSAQFYYNLSYIIIVSTVGCILLALVVLIIKRALCGTIKSKDKHSESSTTNMKLGLEKIQYTDSLQLMHTDQNTVEDENKKLEVVSYEKEEILQINIVNDTEGETAENDDEMSTCIYKQTCASVVCNESFLA